jgi:hypothetical protein
MTPTGKLAHAQNTVKQIQPGTCSIVPDQYNTSYYDIYCSRIVWRVAGNSFDAEAP